MSRKKILNFKIEEVDSKPFVSFEMPTVTLGTETKSLPLQDFVEFCKNFEKSAVIDTGFIVPNVLRNIKNGSREEFLMFYPETQANFTFIINSTSHTEFKEYMKVKTLFKSRKIKSSEQDAYDSTGYLIELVNPLIFKNLYYHLMVDKETQTIYKENIYFSAENEGLFGHTTPKDTSRVVKSIYPNHYGDRVCWGTTGYSHRPILDNLSDGNINFLNTALPTYFNSNFNHDLLFNGIGYWTDTLSNEFLEKFFEWCSTHFNETLMNDLKTKFRSRSEGFNSIHTERDAMFIYMLVLISVSVDMNLRSLFLKEQTTIPLKNVLQLLG